MTPPPIPAEVVDALKACPLCGNATAPRAGTCESFHEDAGDMEGGYQVVCCAGSRKGGCGASTGWQESKEDAIAAWNSRAPSKAERDGVLEVCTEMEVRVDSYAKDYDSLVLNNSTIRDWSSRLRAAMKGRP